MKSSRISLAFGGGYDTIIYSVKKNRFFSYEQERTEIHQIYGGKQYYESRSGLSGVGYLEVAQKDNDLILFGCYRTDAVGGQKIATVHIVNECPIFGYAPITSHGGIDGKAPFVLTDGNKVAFVHACDVKDTLLKWGGIKGKEIEIEWFNGYGDGRKLIFQFCNPDHFKGVRVTRFVDLRYVREQVKTVKLEDLDDENVFSRRLSISKEIDCNKWFHTNVDGIFDIVWTTSPREIVGEIVPGWQSVANGLYWRRARNGVEAFMEIERSSLNGGKYVVEGEISKWLNFEEYISILEWYSKDVEDWKKHFLAKCTFKARQDYIYARQRTGIDTRSLMEQNPDVRICIQDSLDCGNCRPATEDFVKRYGISTDSDGYVTIGALLENRGIDEMLRNFNFQKVVHYKLVDKLNGPGKE